MKFLIDANLPQRLAVWLQQNGYDAVHTLSLPMKNSTPDDEIIQLAIKEERIIVTKDSDFWNYLSFYKLVMVTAGNIGNDDLLRLFEKNISPLIELLNENKTIEINETEIIVHQ
jgi:predicted nuclease of predicted toxin-antitoxin system